MYLTCNLYSKSKLFRYFVALTVLAILTIQLTVIHNKYYSLKTHASAVESEKTSCKQAATLLNSSNGSLPKLPPLQFYMDALNLKSPRRNDSFDPQMNATELTGYINLLWRFLDLCEEHKIDVMMFYGTLIGSYRHHGIIPWDDDVDLLVEESDMKLLKNLILKSSSGLSLVDEGCWRIWNQSACLKTVHSYYKWCWPFIDVVFYRINGHMVNLVGALSNLKYPMQLVFPTHKRPFMGRWVSSPRDAQGCIGFDYNSNSTENCISLQFSHRLYKGLPSQAPIKCSNLRDTYPFVIRNMDTNALGQKDAGVFETLYDHKGCPLYTVFVEEPVIANIPHDRGQQPFLPKGPHRRSP